MGAPCRLRVLRVTRSLARGAHYAALSAVGLATVCLVAAARIAERGWNPWGSLGTLLLLLAATLAPASFLLSWAGRGPLDRRAMMTNSLLCVMAAVIGVTAVLLGELAASRPLHLRFGVALLTVLNLWGLLAAGRLWARPG